GFSDAVQVQALRNGKLVSRVFPVEGGPSAGRVVPGLGDLLHSLPTPPPAAGDAFGYSVAASGGLVVAGAPPDDTGATNAGTAHLLGANRGARLRPLLNPTPAAGDEFGPSVAVAGNFVVVGAPNDNTGAARAGAAYLFDATSGTLLQTLLNPTPA